MRPLKSLTEKYECGRRGKAQKGRKKEEFNNGGGDQNTSEKKKKDKEAEEEPDRKWHDSRHVNINNLKRYSLY